MTRKQSLLAYVSALVAASMLSACQAEGPSSPMPGNADDFAPFEAIGESETVNFSGTEPFWAGTVTGSALTYSTPERPDGDTVKVERFAGRGGVSWTGVFDGARLALAVTPGDCSDGMSDRRFPFFATIKIRGEQRSGCAWTDKSPFTGPAQP
ncbi:COG3650 family protein [Tsuneonella amylolytica]|uniref:COG3650 family protein n=1 Tax=Tsuneonella amylolytica TaxID=2338327 RepID=UPI000EA861B7|nr:hypothetical protein [Tsuneonella amylolytica]